ncbi:MAG TPA: biotin/lipoyl-containing protein [Candidatus Binataceae bacterium]|nr:biotin/lipoyl-containing protein [Candidatus Binataceae bacterium]
MKLKSGGREFEVEIIAREGRAIRARVEGREILATIDALGDSSAILSLGERRFRLLGARRKDAILVAVGPRTFDFVPAESAARRAHGGLAAAEVTAPMPGKILKVLVKDGDLVSAGQPLVVIEAMKMETALAAESDAIVKRVRVAPGDTIDHGAVLVELSPAPVASAPQSGREDR